MRSHRILIPVVALAIMTGSVVTADSAGAAHGVTRPGAPTNVVTSSAGFGLKVTWSPPLLDGGSPVVAYWVSGLFNGKVSYSASARGPLSCTLAPIGRHRYYRVTVRAINAVGEGPPSTPLY